MGFFASHCRCSEPGASASRVLAPVKGRRATKIICSSGNGRMGDAERLIKEGRVGVCRLEVEAKESAERAARAEAERDAACHEAAIAKLAIEEAINTQAQIESKLARVQRVLALAEDARQRAESEHGAAREALVVVREAYRKAEEESGRLTDEILALIMELGTIKDEFVAFREKAAADRETMEAKFDSSGDVLFNYGYGCCVFMHNIYGSKPQIPDEMSDPSVPLTPKFFANPRCPPGTSAAAPALSPIAVSKEDRSENSPAAAGEETTLPMNLLAE